MLKHIVLFKLNDFENEDQKALIRKKITKALLALKDSIKEVKMLEVGENYELNSTAFDISLVSEFESFADLEIYRVHPEHLKVVDLIRANTCDRAVVDYEF